MRRIQKYEVVGLGNTRPEPGIQDKTSWFIRKFTILNWWTKPKAESLKMSLIETKIEFWFLKLPGFGRNTLVSFVPNYDSHMNVI